VRKRKAEEKTPQKSPPKAARITNWFSRQNTSSSRRSSTNAELDPSVKTYDAFVQTDDDASRAVIAAYKKAADDAEAARRVAEEAGARQLQELGNQERSRREALEASHEAQLSRYRSELQDRIRRECALQREAARDGLHADLVTVGRPVMQRSSGSFVEVTLMSMVFVADSNANFRSGKRGLLFGSFRGGWTSYRLLVTTLKNPNESALPQQKNAGKYLPKTLMVKPVF
jgi:hypothetical protein